MMRVAAHNTAPLMIFHAREMTRPKKTPHIIIAVNMIKPICGKEYVYMICSMVSFSLCPCELCALKALLLKSSTHEITQPASKPEISLQNLIP